MTKPTHYLRFVQAIILAAAVPACSGASETPAPPADTQVKGGETNEVPQATEKTEPAEPAEQKTPPAESGGEPQPFSEETADAGADAKLPFSSGPQMPPVLPVGFA